jgi:hypothetical protein
LSNGDPNVGPNTRRKAILIKTGIVIERTLTPSRSIFDMSCPDVSVSVFHEIPDAHSDAEHIAVLPTTWLEIIRLLPLR